ncbi:hypothetical protein CSOJ01_08501 [Colletotrichum sojae]|uniref:Uncharacterized protein n=1 Tax=Colletotrichum sojae TaxID=2175907 RepID=A0A8H6MRY5_9PEZI|nr:hypothetical protein CSOJ01_08501 [Colletotrichum sojae]
MRSDDDIWDSVKSRTFRRMGCSQGFDGRGEHTLNIPATKPLRTSRYGWIQGGGNGMGSSSERSPSTSTRQEPVCSPGVGLTAWKRGREEDASALDDGVLDTKCADRIRIQKKQKHGETIQEVGRDAALGDSPGSIPT